MLGAGGQGTRRARANMEVLRALRLEPLGKRCSAGYLLGRWKTGGRGGGGSSLLCADWATKIISVRNSVLCTHMKSCTATCLAHARIYTQAHKRTRTRARTHTHTQGAPSLSLPPSLCVCVCVCRETLPGTKQFMEAQAAPSPARSHHTAHTP